MTKPAQKLVRFDWAMKNILRDKANFDVLEGFLTSLLKEPITIIELLESESNKDYSDQKSNRVDLKCKDSAGRQIIVEVQSQRQTDYFERIAWGASKALVESLKSGDEYFHIAKVISVSILFHDLFDTEPNDDYLYRGTTEIIGCHNKKPLLARHGVTDKSVTSSDVMPEYYIICVNNFGDEIVEQIDEWVYIFKNETTQKSFHSPGINSAKKKLDYLGMSKEERAKYDVYVSNVQDAANVLYTSRGDAKREGRAEGLVEGKAIGIEEGEAKANRETARRMLAMKLSLDVIEQATGIPSVELRKLHKEK